MSRSPEKGNRLMTCRNCNCDNTKKFGRTQKGTQRYRCKDCGASFVAPEPKPLGDMRIPMKKARLIIKLLVEGNSISATARIADCHKATVLALILKMGEKCERIMDRFMRNIECRFLQVDEAWTFIRKKQSRRLPGDPEEWGDCYVFAGIDAETKLVPVYRLGKRDALTTFDFIADLAHRTTGPIHISSDGFQPFESAIYSTMLSRADYAQVVKQYGSPPEEERRKYSPSGLIAIVKRVVFGDPDMEFASTSYIERQNRTLRMGLRRFTRLVDAFSKKFKYLKAAVALHYAHYNFCRIHSTLSCTPAMEAGIVDKLWTIDDLILEGSS